MPTTIRRCPSIALLAKTLEIKKVTCHCSLCYTSVSNVNNTCNCCRIYILFSHIFLFKYNFPLFYTRQSGNLFAELLAVCLVPRYCLCAVHLAECRKMRIQLLPRNVRNTFRRKGVTWSKPNKHVFHHNAQTPNKTHIFPNTNPHT